MKLRLRVTQTRIIDGAKEAVEFAPVREQCDGPGDHAPIALDGNGVLTAADRVALEVGVDKLRSFLDARLAAGFGALSAALPEDMANVTAQLPPAIVDALMVMMRAVLEGAARDVAADVHAGALANDITMAFAVHDAKAIGLVKAGAEYDVEFTEVAP